MIFCTVFEPGIDDSSKFMGDGFDGSLSTILSPAHGDSVGGHIIPHSQGQHNSPPDVSYFVL
jgi:hypothetical protein